MIASTFARCVSVAFRSAKVCKADTSFAEQKSTRFYLWLVPLLFSTLPNTVSAQESDAPSATSTKSYHRDVLPIFRQHCQGCHQGAKKGGDYMMTQFASLLSGGESGEIAVVPGKPDDSYLIKQITPVDGHAEMPAGTKQPLSEVEIETIRTWIAQGAVNDSPVQELAFDLEHPPTYRNPPSFISVDASADGKWIALAGYHEVLLLDATSGTLVQRLIGTSSRINSVRFSPDSGRLAVSGGVPGVEGEVQIWAVPSGELQLSKKFTHDTLYGIAWSDDGTRVSFGAADNTLRAIQASDGTQVLFQGAHEDWVLGTAFTVGDTNLVSVARDMTCKLTEVATERFIDNVTSITPGALAGGLNSVVRHPSRDEVMVGGADGVAKVYRLFRISERKIGDDANLVRQMPAIPGRIFSVDISRDGKYLAAAATLDGRSEVRVWNYDFDGTYTDELKALAGKDAKLLSPEEKKKLDDFRSSPITQVWKADIPTTAVYAISFRPDSSLIVAGSDGKVRWFGTDGQMKQEVEPIAVTADSVPAQSSLAFDAQKWNQLRSDRISTDAAQTSSLAQPVVALEISPSEIKFTGPYDYAQFVVTGKFADGSTKDVTRDVTWTVPDTAVITRSGWLRPVRSGKGELKATIGAVSVSVPFESSKIEREHAAAVDFVRDVNPVLSRLGCNQGTCHGAQAGKNGFKLSLRGYDPIFDLRALTDDHAGRRINAADPAQSLMLLKPVGLVPHEGGALMKATDPDFSILNDWISGGCKLRLDTPRVTEIRITPLNPVVTDLGSQQQVRVVAYYQDGLQRDVTAQAFVTSGNAEVAEADQTGLLTAVRRGEAPILARYEGAYAATTLTVMGDRTGFQWQEPEQWSPVDRFVADKWKRMRILPSDLCTDEEFIRRASIDLTGMLPSTDDVRAFLADQTETRIKRSQLVDRLIASNAYVEFWTNKWADLLQVNRKFLGVEGSAAYRNWIRDSVKNNEPYNEFVRKVLTASGSNRVQPAASYYKVLRNPEEIMENTTHLFLGIRFNCNKCHDHPFERWTQDQYYETAAYFSRTALKADPESKGQTVGGSAVEGAKPMYEEVFDKNDGELKHQRTGKDVAPKFPYSLASIVQPPTEQPPAADAAAPAPVADANTPRRQQLADWIASADNAYFAKSYVNRVWAYLLGPGLIEPIDDIRAGNPATNPELLDFLTHSFIESGFDRQELMRQICNSRTYQLSIKTNQWNADDNTNYSHAMPRRLSAEVLFDAVHQATGSASHMPGVAVGTRAAELPDAGAQTEDGFLQNLGRPVRESACECERSSDLQLGPVMALVSGPTVGSAIASNENILKKLNETAADDQSLVDELYLRTLARHPREAEVAAFTALKTEIEADHQGLLAKKAEREAWWKDEEPKLQAAREERIKQAEQAIAAAVEAAKPEQERLAKEREERIAKANATLAEVQAKLPERIAAWEQQQNDATEWFPVVPRSMVATNKSELATLEDRSIFATGNSDKGVYELTFETGLANITGIRLEALPIDFAAGKGPGLADNSNFVLTEFELETKLRADDKQVEKLKLTGGVADFSQDSFAPDQVVNGQTQDQGGWAINGSNRHPHWIVFKLEKPISDSGSKQLVVKLHQFHNAEKHRLGRFRISFTTAAPEQIKLGLAEPYRAIISRPLDKRSDADKQLLTTYFEATDGELKKANGDLATGTTWLCLKTLA